MNTTGLNILKTLGCITAVTFFSLFNTGDRYGYDHHWLLGFLTFFSTIATPLFFIITGYLNAQTRHDAQWQVSKITKLVIVFLFWMAIYYLWTPWQRSYLIQPWFVFSFLVIYVFHPVVEWLSQRRRLFCAVIFALLLFSYGYDLLSALYPQYHALSLEPQYRFWTWLLFYLTGQLLCDPLVAAWISREKVVKTTRIALPFIYLLTWLYERHFFFALFKADKNAFLLTGSQIYILAVALVITVNGIRFHRHRALKESLLALVSKAMTGVYILHYSVFYLLSELIPVHSLAIRLPLIIVTFVLSVLISLLVMSNNISKKIITL